MASTPPSPLSGCTEGRDVAGRLRLGHGDTDVRAVAGRLDGAIRQLGARRGWL
jgi:sporulation-control protein